MMRLVFCLPALIGATRAKDMRADAFAWPWDQDTHHAAPHHLGGSMMAARSRVHHGNMFDTSSNDFSTDFSSDSDSSGGDFMDKYITETGGKPMSVDDDKPKVQKQDEPSIPDMASLFNSDEPKAQPKAQQPWAEQSSSSGSSSMDNLFGGSFGFDAPSKPSYSFDAPAKTERPTHNVDSDSIHTDDMTNLFGGSSDSAPAQAASSSSADSSSDSASGWPWNTHAKKEEKSDEHHSRDLWSSHSDSDSSSGSGSSSSSDMANMFGGSGFSAWSTNDFGSSKSGVSQPAHAPQQQDDAPQRPADSDSPIQGPTQRESSISGATATDQVVDVRLSSELQQSLLQARSAETRMLQRFRGSN